MKKTWLLISLATTLILAACSVLAKQENKKDYNLPVGRYQCFSDQGVLLFSNKVAHFSIDKNGLIKFILPKETSIRITNAKCFLIKDVV